MKTVVQNGFLIVLLVFLTGTVSAAPLPSDVKTSISTSYEFILNFCNGRISMVFIDPVPSGRASPLNQGKHDNA